MTVTNPSDAARRILTETFGYSAFRPTQDAVIAHVESGGSALLVMPTGGGKSLCYQIPSLTRPGTGLVVSPLIALMQDQVDALEQLGVPAAFLNSSQTLAEQNEVLSRLRSGALEMLYVAPERAVTERFLSVADHVDWSLLAIDEAHCISQWGHEFRPEYRELSTLRERWPSVPCLAVTATADEPTRRDVAAQLGIHDVFVTGFDRANLHYSVTPKIDPRKQLVAWLRSKHDGDAGIVYCGTRRKCEQVADWLRAEGLDAHAYHAGMESSDRSRVQRKFLREDGVIVVATIAFGMGIDKPDVRFVVHLDLPKSLEAYYQESGRAGRDGLPSDCWMLFGWQDVVRVSQMIGEMTGADGSVLQHRITERRKLDQLIGWTESVECRRAGLLRYFDDITIVSHERCCDNCESPPETIDATVDAQKLLSCVRRTGERFGVVHVIDVLRGQTNDKVQRFGHDGLSTFGIGAEHDAIAWRSIARQLVAQGLLRVDVEAHGSLRLTPASWDVLKGERDVRVKIDRAPAAVRASTGSSKKRASSSAAELDDAARELYERLRALRKRIADEQNVPAYVIFHDKTLAQIATERPRSLEAMAGITGVGTKKLERYGALFLDELG